ncbi:hypothetical protein AiwAL_15985 [Acidiphilium sp. AL]|uniref:Uncharacterized protein n=1 Tax=Acidiphilium iwatense TaxID=768198 RepID=A0ABS9DYG7_9PROT|nr:MULTISPECIES: hypothetical protein [Acidiphilium]MCF3947796.1 hypothetical protein [Acidiphilium iwatense]MCU4161582.1 hypothetical protein [Acidiphilium sp. AL]
MTRKVRHGNRAPLIAALSKLHSIAAARRAEIAASLIAAAELADADFQWNARFFDAVRTNHRESEIRLVKVTERFDRTRRKLGQPKASFDAATLWEKPLIYEDRRRHVPGLPRNVRKTLISRALIAELEHQLGRKLRFSRNTRNIGGGPDIRVLVEAWKLIPRTEANQNNNAAAATFFISLIRFERRHHHKTPPRL